MEQISTLLSALAILISVLSFYLSIRKFSYERQKAFKESVYKNIVSSIIEWEYILDDRPNIQEVKADLQKVDKKLHYHLKIGLVFCPEKICKIFYDYIELCTNKPTKEIFQERDNLVKKMFNEIRKDLDLKPINEEKYWKYIF